MIAKEVGGLSLRLSDQAWDSEMLGLRCGYLEISRSGNESVPDADALTSGIAEVLDRARSDEIRFVTLKTDAEEMGAVNAALRNKGLLIDTEMTFSKRRVASDIEIEVPDDYSIRKLERYWDDSLYLLADTLRYSRFFVDANIGVDLASKVWRNSIYNNCNGRASYSLVGFHGDRPIGLMNVFETNEVSDVFVIAVSPAHQNRGIGRAMMDVYERKLGSEIERQIVETQLINYGAQKFYVSRGYRASRSKHVIHFWL